MNSGPLLTGHGGSSGCCPSTIPLDETTSTLLVSQEQTGTVDGLANDPDVYGDPLAVTIPEQPSVGTATITLPGIVHFVPDQGFQATVAIAYLAGDGMLSICPA